MREIKFRAWEKNLKEIIHVNSINFKGKTINVESAWRMFDEVELMQFTGLLDKNGKEIYEGDLLQITRYPGENYYLEIAKSDDPPHNFICGYRKKPDADVRGISDGIFEILEEDLSDYEVVCNIYEHPNLLGGDQ